MRAVRTAALITLIAFAAACGAAEPSSTPSVPATTSEPPESPTPCPTIAQGPVQLCGKVQDKGHKDLTAQGQDVKVTINGLPSVAFSPTFLKTVPGAEVTVTFVNTGTAEDFIGAHSFVIESLDVAVVLKRGQRKSVTFSLPEGEPFVAFKCTVEFHLAGGMQGAFYFD